MALFSRPDAGRYKEAVEAALEVSGIAATAVSLPEAVDAMVRCAARLLKADQGSIMLLDDAGSVLELAASAGLPAGAAPGHRVPVGGSVGGRVLARGEPLLLDDVSSGRAADLVRSDKPVASSVIVPLRAQGRAVGVLSLARLRGKDAFVEDDLGLAQLFADQVAGLIHRARLHDRAERRSSDLMALVESSRGLLAELNADVLMQRILDGACRLAGSHRGFACMLDGSTGAITKGVFRDLDKSAIRTLLNATEVRDAVHGTEAVLFENEILGTSVAVGFTGSRSTQGVFVVAAEGHLAADRVDLFRAFAQQCSSALASADLHGVLGRKESELSAIIQAVPNPIVMADPAGAIIACNSAAEELFGLSSTFSLGVPVKGSLGHEEVESLLADGGVAQRDVRVGVPPRTYRARVAEVRMPEATLGRVLIMDDVTAEREAAQIQRDFVAMIGHELRTPLTIIKGFARTLLRRADKVEPAEVAEAVTTIDARAAHLERLIEDLLHISRIESREAALRVEDVNLTAVIERVAAEVLVSFEDRKVRLEVPSELVWPCDEAKIALVLRHLIDNALEYSDVDSPVLVRAGVGEGELRVDIVDKGQGLLSSDIPHIFDRFRQVDSSSTREHGGTGVGLYLCSQLIRLHGGRIWVDSAWGKGSTFSFVLARDPHGGRVVSLTGARTAQEEEASVS